MARYPFESPWLYGMHDPGGEHVMLEARRPGWVVFAEAIGHDPQNRSGVDYRQFSSRELAVLCRINNGFFPQGTIPHSSQYANFARRCANFVAASPGCKIWIIGNEPNYSIERPHQTAAPMGGARGSNPYAATPPRNGRSHGARERESLWQRLVAWLRRQFVRQDEGAPAPVQSAPQEKLPPGDDPMWRGRPERFGALYGIVTSAQDGVMRQAAGEEVITPNLYARCYQLCREAIRRVPGHEEDLVIVAAVAPWNNQTVYPGNPRGDWVQYLADVLALLQQTGCDGIALHAYTHGSSPALITNDARMQPPFEDRRYDFRVYQDFLAAVPPSMRGLPVYITETDQVEPWTDANSGWVQRAYAEIERWNSQPGVQPVRSLVLYRWPWLDRWYIEGKNGVINDFRAAILRDYRWDHQPDEAKPLRKGDVLAVTAYLNLRKEPGYLSKPADDVVRALAPGQRVTILDGDPREVDGLVWWHVRTSDAPQVVGWLAQNGPDGAVYVERIEEAPPPQPPPTEPPPPMPSFKVGDRVRTQTIVNARRSPGVAAKPADDVVMEVPAGTVLTIAGGPKRADGLIWWQVKGSVGGQAFDAWMAEQTQAGERLLERDESPPSPPPPGPPAPVPRFRPGDRAMTVNFVRLRKSPGFMNKPADDVVADIWQGTPVTILNGPRTEDDLTWWEVETTDSLGHKVRGWMADTAPGGLPLLSVWAEEDRTPFKVRDLAVVGALSVRARRTPGYQNKPDIDVLGEFTARTTLFLVEGPRAADGLSWWRTSGVAGSSAVVGWVAESAPGGGPLLGRGTKLPGTEIPNLRAGKFLGRPFDGSFGISQLWGENAAFYARYTYDGVPLVGHNGIDFLTPPGTRVSASDAGEVAMTGFEPGGFGNYVLLSHSWGESAYAHLESIAVQVGQRVERGSTLGRSGNTGGSTGPHLHFAIRIHPYQRTDGWGGYSDPLPYMDPKDVIWPEYMLEAPAVAVAGGAPSGPERMPPPRMAEDAPGLTRP